MINKSMAFFLAAFFAVSGHAAKTAYAEAQCEAIETKPVKIEAWISKRFKKNKRAIKKEMGSLDHTKVMLRVFPMKDPAPVMAIGKCVPVEIAQHAIRQALKYTAGVNSLVNQQALYTHWVGIGTMNFDEYTQRAVTADQLKQLMDASLNTEAFQSLYRKLATMSDTVKGFGMTVPNPRKTNK
ncbi:MAG: hypothetical protein ACE5GQ_04405 [Nitrospinales bacterium]